MKNLLPNKISFLCAVLVILSLFSLSSAQTNQTDQNDSSSKSASPTKAIDTSAYDKEIESAAKVLNEKPQNKAFKRKLATAYAARGLALVDAAQYKAALGDLRRCLKLDPKNKKAKEMRDEIISIYKSIGRKPPEEGEEPPPLSFNKN